jgi:hypothetical protein
MKFLSDIRLLILGIWLGAACFFIAVAQSAFAVLPSPEMAGAVVNRTLSVLNYSGLAIALLLLLTSLIVRRDVSKFWIWIERFLLLIVAAACAVGQFVIGLMMLSLRAQMGKPLEEIAADDPLRMQFDVLHLNSQWVLMAAMIASLIAFFIISNRKFNPTVVASASGETTSNPFDFDKPFKK